MAATMKATQAPKAMKAMKAMKVMTIVATNVMKAMKANKTMWWTKKWSGFHQGPYVRWTLARVTIDKGTRVVTENWKALAVDEHQTAMKAMKMMKAVKAKK